MRLPPKKFSETGRRREDVEGTPEYKTRAREALERVRHAVPDEDAAIVDAVLALPGRKLKVVSIDQSKLELRAVAAARADGVLQVDIPPDVSPAVAKALTRFNKKMVEVHPELEKRRAEQAEIDAINLKPIVVSCLPCAVCSKPVNPSKGMPVVLEWGKKAPGAPEFIGLPWKSVAHAACVDLKKKRA